MSKLKLFVSHSSRLDDVDGHGLPLQHNWELLQQTCKAIRAAYGDSIEILVDQDEKGLYPGVDWERRLNEWIADCHAAIILFSKRALESSTWVQKEATVLSWRREVEDGFTLIPVPLEGQCSIQDLQQDIWATLRIDKSQCPKAASGPDDILDAVKLAIGEPSALKLNAHKTPFGRLEAVVSRILTEAHEETLEEAWGNLEEIEDKPSYQPDRKLRFSVALTQYLFRDGEKCLSAFQRVLGKLEPKLSKARAKELFEYLRALWVEPAAAGGILSGLKHKLPVALNGRLVCYNDKLLDTQCYTAERFLERAWPGPKLHKIVSVEGMKPAEEIKAEIRRSCLGELPPFIDAETQDREINRDPKTLVLVISALSDQGGLPDPRQLAEVSQIYSHYKKIVVIFNLGGCALQTLPATVQPVEPPLDCACESAAFQRERLAKDFLNTYTSE